MRPSAARATLIWQSPLSYGSQDVALRLVLTPCRPPSPPGRRPRQGRGSRLPRSRRPTFSRARRHDRRRGLVARLAAALVASNEFLLEGIKRTSAAKAAFLLQLSVVFTPALEYFVLRRRQGARVWPTKGPSCVCGLRVSDEQSGRLLRHNPAADRRFTGRGRGDGVGGVHRAHGRLPSDGRSRCRPARTLLAPGYLR